MITNNYIKKFEIKSDFIIAEGMNSPKITIIHFDDSKYIYNSDKLSFDLLDNTIKNHINIVCLKQIRKKKLFLLNEIR